MHRTSPSSAPVLPEDSLRSRGSDVSLEGRPGRIPLTRAFDRASGSLGWCVRHESAPTIPSGPEHALQVGVGEHATGIQPVAQGQEVVEPRIELPEPAGVEVCSLPQCGRPRARPRSTRTRRSTASGPCASTGGRRRTRSRAGTPVDSQGRRRRRTGSRRGMPIRSSRASIQRAQLGDHRPQRGPRDGVLTSHGSGPAAATTNTAAECVDEGRARLRARPANSLIRGAAPGDGADLVDQPEHSVGQQLVVEPAGASPTAARARPSDAVVAFGQHPVGVREPVQSTWSFSAVQAPTARAPRPVSRSPPRPAAGRSARTGASPRRRPERTEADRAPRGSSSAFSSAEHRSTVPSPVIRVEPADLGRPARRAGCHCRGCRSRWRRRRSAGRCRPGWAGPARTTPAPG